MTNPFYSEKCLRLHIDKRRKQIKSWEAKKKEVIFHYFIYFTRNIGSECYTWAVESNEIKNTHVYNT